MVKIREGLPLVDGQTTQADSATLAAQLVASQRSHQSANSYAQIPLDIKYQLATHKLHTTFDRSAQHAYHSHDPNLENEYLDNQLSDAIFSQKRT
jgi:GTP pyrophosphokinase